MENNDAKTIIEIYNHDFEEEINKLEIEIIPNTKLNSMLFDHTFKLIVLGNAGVGKSCLSLKGTTGKFIEYYEPTVG